MRTQKKIPAPYLKLLNKRSDLLIQACKLNSKVSLSTATEAEALELIEIREQVALLESKLPSDLYFTSYKAGDPARCYMQNRVR